MDVASTSQQDWLAVNLEALRVVGGGLAERVESLPAESRFSLIPAADGSWTARIACEDGSAVLLASARDPATEAARWVDSVLDDGRDEHTIAVVGCGLGYHVAELLRRRRGGLVVVIDPDPAAVHAALRCRNFAADLLTRRLTFVVAGERTDLFDPLAPHGVELMLGTHLTQHPATGRARPAACSRLQRLFTEYLHFVRTSVGTALDISAASTNNVLCNLPTYLAWPGVEPLKGAWAGRPGVCVAAGPSLRKNMHLLKALKGRAVVIAVQTVLRPLLEAGIRPDFVTALDYSPVSRRFYEGLDELPDVTLVVDAKVHPIVPDSFPGPRRIFQNAFAARLLEPFDAARQALPAGSTVAHLNLYLAQHLGCDPIVLVGQDLGFTDNVYYAPGNPIHSVWAGELNRFNTLEMMEWQRIVRMRTGLRRAPAQDGGEVYTDAQMFTYLQKFERDIAACPAKVINATEGGVVIAGAEMMSLAEVIERFCASAEPRELPAPPRVRPDAAERLAEGAARLRERQEQLGRMDEICRKVLDPLEQMTDSLNDAPRFNRLHAVMDQWRVKIDSVSQAYALVCDVAQVAEMRRVQLDLALQRKQLDPIAERREQLTRDIQYVRLLRQGIEVLRRSIEQSLRRVEEYRPWGPTE